MPERAGRRHHASVTTSRTVSQANLEPLQAVDALEAALGAGDVERAIEPFDVDAVLEVGSEQWHVVGRPAIRQYLEQLLRRFPNLGLRVVARYRDGLTVIDELLISGIDEADQVRSVVGVFDVRAGVVHRATIYQASPRGQRSLDHHPQLLHESVPAGGLQ